MKKIFNRIAILFAVVLFTGACTKVSNIQPTLEDRISQDASLKKAIDNATDLYTSLSRTYINSADGNNELEAIATKINNKTATAADYKRVQDIVGLPYDEFIAKVRNFALSLNDLNKAFPELSKMKQAELQSTLTKAIDANTELRNSLGKSIVVNGKVEKCPLRDICNLAVTLTKMFAGDAICVAINVTTIPVVGGLLCSLVLNIGAGLLTAICNALPC